jgi:hypothetical protein
MQLVAIAELTGAAEASIASLAAALETTVYELRLVLNAGLPAVVLATVDPARAQSAVAAIARSGHIPVSCDRADVTPSRRMTALRNFSLDGDGFRPDSASRARFAYSDLGAILRATHRSTTETSETVKERKFRPVMAAATGGLVLTKKTTREVTTRTEHREQVLYLCSRSGQPPWILREREAHYGGLGADLSPASSACFQTTIRRLRESAPSAAYDERLTSGRPIRGVAEGSDATDILAHLLAKHLLR